MMVDSLAGKNQLLTHRITSFGCVKNSLERSTESTCKQAKTENTCSGFAWCGSCTNMLYSLNLQGSDFWLVNRDFAKLCFFSEIRLNFSNHEVGCTINCRRIEKNTLHGTDISHLGKRKLIFKSALV